MISGYRLNYCRRQKVTMLAEYFIERFFVIQRCDKSIACDSRRYPGAVGFGDSGQSGTST